MNGVALTPAPVESMMDSDSEITTSELGVRDDAEESVTVSDSTLSRLPEGGVVTAPRGMLGQRWCTYSVRV